MKRAGLTETQRSRLDKAMDSIPYSRREVDITDEVYELAEEALKHYLASESSCDSADVDLGAARRFAYAQFVDARNPPRAQEAFKLLANFLAGEDVPEVSVHAEPLFKLEKKQHAA